MDVGLRNLYEVVLTQEKSKEEMPLGRSALRHRSLLNEAGTENNKIVKSVLF